VRERPEGISDTDVATALARHWPVTVQELSYLPVGFGGYHWLAVDQTGTRWFVTVSDLAAPWVPDLSAAMRTAVRLATEAALDFVVAPVPTPDGQVIGSLGGQHALTLFPYLDAAASHFGDPIDDADRAAIIDMLAALHSATPNGIPVPTRPLELSSRQAIDDALGSLNDLWRGGPYAEPARHLLIRFERPLRRARAQFDALLSQVRAANGPHVITHGEPHPGNLLRTQAGLRLIDWDMVALAPPERDLWWVINSDQDADRYARATGRPVNQDALTLYRLRWALDDTADFLAEIRGPHQQTADTLVSWNALQQTLSQLSRHPAAP
jgi:spectinomycin phosphotransferase